MKMYFSICCMTVTIFTLSAFCLANEQKNHVCFNIVDANKDGKVTSSCSYGKTYTRLEYILDKRIKEQADKLTQEIVSMVDKKIEAKKAQIHKQAIEKITKKLGLDV